MWSRMSDVLVVVCVVAGNDTVGSTGVLNELVILPRSTKRYSALSDQRSAIGVSMPAPTVQPSLVLPKLAAAPGRVEKKFCVAASVSVWSPRPYAAPPVA